MLLGFFNTTVILFDRATVRESTFTALRPIAGRGGRPSESNRTASRYPPGSTMPGFTPRGDKRIDKSGDHVDLYAVGTLHDVLSRQTNLNFLATLPPL